MSWRRLTAEHRADLIEQVQAKSIDGFLPSSLQSGGMPTATYTSQSSGDFITNRTPARMPSNDGMWLTSA